MKSASGNSKPTFEGWAWLRSESLRWALVLGAGLWLAHPYFSPRLIGVDDALWYHHLLADAVLQFRAGEFPLYVGQSDFMFNGAVYPHRVAPYHQYLAGLIDLLTGRTLGFFALQHLTIILSFVGATSSAYFVLTRLDPDRRWPAALLAFLYASCPGVMGLAYAQDLYMSVMTLPWVPLALGGAWLTFRENSWRALGMTVTAIGALWWAHAPIAMWVTAIVSLQQLVRLASIRPLWPCLGRGLAAAGLLAALLVYPVVSAFLLRTSGESVVPYRMDRSLLLQQIQGAFPANILPLNPATSPLSHLQAGYALAAALVTGALAAGWRRQLTAAFALGAASLLLVLVLPVPGVSRALWLGLPEAVVGLTLYWPMQRLYIVFAGLVIIGVWVAFAGATLPRRAEQILLGALIVGAGWSATQARVFHRTAMAQGTTPVDSAKWGLTENATPTRHAYHLFGSQPTTMSHGVMDAQLESRLLDPETQRPLPRPAPAVPWQTFTGTLDANPGILNLAPALRLEPGRRHRLVFDFFDRDYTGVLQVSGPGFYREYLLPASGNPRAFGTGANASRELSFWTSQPTPVDVKLRFIPTQPGASAGSFATFARFAWEETEPANAPIELHGLIPYRATVRTVSPALLETPRLYVPGYTAAVGDVPATVLRTAEGFVGVPVPGGNSEVTVRFTGPLALRAAFALSAAAWLALAVAFPITFTRSLTNRP